MMSISLVGSPSTARSTTSTVTLASWAQAPAAGNLLIAVIGGGGSTAANFSVSQHTGTTGWAQLLSAPVGSNTGGTDNAGVDVWYKVAGTGEPLPGFTAVVSGTLATQLAVFELSGAAAILDTSGSFSSGSSSGSVTFSAATDASVLAAGEFAISAFVQERTATTMTWSETGSGWTAAFSDGATSSRVHIQVNYQANPAAGAALSDSGSFSTRSSAFGAGVVLVIGLPKADSDAGAGAGDQLLAASVRESEVASGLDQVWWGGERAHMSETEAVSELIIESVSSSDTGMGTGEDLQLTVVSSDDDAGTAEGVTSPRHAVCVRDVWEAKL